jgi:hypothetical protein
MKTFWTVIKILVELSLFAGFIYFAYMKQLERAAILYLVLCHIVNRDMIDELKDEIRKLKLGAWGK